MKGRIFYSTAQSKTFYYYIGLTALITFILYNAFTLWQADLRIPFNYNGDSLWNLFYIKTIMDTGGYWINPYLGAPFSGQYYDFPHNFIFEITTIRFLGAIFHEIGLVHNLYYLLGFVFTAWSACWVLCRLGVERLLAVAGAIVFSLLPYHFMRLGHLSLSNYCTVPIAAWLALELASKDLDYEAKLDYPHLTTRFIAASFVGIGPAYYVFLGAFVTLYGGIIGTVATRNWKRMFIASLFAVTMLGIFVAENTSSIIFRWQNGKNVEAVRRSAPESEIFGLHITQLLLPQFEHRFKPFAIAAEKYKEHTPLINENITSYLGIISSVGFLLLIGSVMTGMRDGTIPYLRQLGLLLLFTVLLGTIGGFGALFAWIITPYIRAWNRISVFIAFFSLAGLLLVLQHLILKFRGWKRKIILFNAAFVLVCGAYWDQTAPSFVPNYKELSREFLQDGYFARTAEVMLPQGTKIFQMPYLPFPEQLPLFHEGAYGLMRAYLHSSTLKWSYGAIKGRKEDAWIRSVSSLPIEEQIKTLKDAGFGALWIERDAYKDGAVPLETRLYHILGHPILVSPDNNIVIYRLRPDK